jgi:glycosyltransferase involved in cell wall biosynthesis
MKVAVVTPYYKEPDDKLLRCLRSVAAQDYPVTHFMVADGHANPCVAEAGVMHIVLPQAHRDYGNTPRSIGAISALNLGHTAIAFLDADNWYEPNHISSLVEAVGRSGAHAGISGRKIVLPNGIPVPGPDPEDVSGAHADTSTYLITDKAAFLLPVWAMMDQAVSQIGDRMFLALMQALKVPYVMTGIDTMNYESNYRYHFERAGQPLPDKLNDIDLPTILARQSRERTMARMRMSLLLSVRETD